MVKAKTEAPPNNVHNIGSNTTLWGNPQVMDAAVWLVANGYPDDWTTQSPPPMDLVRAMAIAVSVRDEISVEDAFGYLCDLLGLER